jgi:putative hydrolase of the HAD superfamily
MPGPDWRTIDTWVFDLDNTLYPSAINLFGQIDVKMTAYVAKALALDTAEARAVQKRYFHDHGTTLQGLMANHDVAPDDFLRFVHDIDFGVLTPDLRLDSALARLPGRKLIYTNADAPYAAQVLEGLGIAHHFDVIHDIVATNYVPKPEPAGYHQLLADHDVEPTRAVFVEDMARNLRPARALGMATVWVNNGSEWGAAEHHPDHIDLEIACVSTWLDEVVSAE